MPEDRLDWGSFDTRVTRHLPPPLERLSDGSQVAISKSKIGNSCVYLSASHPLSPDGEYFVIDWTAQLGLDDYVLMRVDNPTLDANQLPPSTIVKLDGQAFELLSAEQFADALTAMQKKIGERANLDGNEQNALWKQDLRGAFESLQKS